MNDRRHHPDENQKAAPKRLARALTELNRVNCAVLPDVDRSVLRAAREHLQTVRANPPHDPRRVAISFGEWLISIGSWICGSGMPIARWTAPAAILLIASALALLRYGPATNHPLADLNRDGQVDILDALALAQQIERGARIDRDLDLNGDGQIDRRDADALAMRAVRIENGSPL